MFRRERIAIAAALAFGLFAPQARADDASDCRGTDPDRAIAGCTALIGRGGAPTSLIIAQYNRALAYMKRSRHAEAVIDLTAAINAAAIAGIGSTEQAEFHGQRGLAHRMLNRLDLAIADFGQAIATNGRNGLYYVGRGEAYEALGRYQEAVADLTFAVQLMPSLTRARVALARSQEGAQRPQDALASFAQALQIEPRSATILAERGDLLVRLNRLDEAMTDYNAAVGFDPGFARAYHGRGIVQAARQQYASAVIDFDKALQLNPRFALAYNDRGNAQVNLNNFQVAVADYDKCLEMLPTFARAYNNRGFAKWRLGRRTEALADYSKAIALDSTYAEAYANRAELHLQNGQYDLAATDFLAAGKLNPRLEAARRGQNRVVEAKRGAGLVANAAPVVPPVVPAPTAVPLAPAQTAPKPPPGPVVVLPPPGQAVPASPPGAVAVLPAPLGPNPIPPVTAGTGRRVALVIGNAKYQNTPALINPTNDAADVASALKRIGFEVIDGQNLTKREMDDAFRRFARIVAGADVSLFFYAGHAMQHNGTNYLMPVDAALKEETDLKYEMAQLSDVLTDMDKSGGVRIAIVDACRDNPLDEKLKRSISKTRSGSFSRGLAPMTKVDGSFYVFATLPGNTAEDGQGRNSPFTEALLRHIETPGMELNTLFRRVASSVKLSTRGRQTPEMTSSVTEDVFLVRQN